MRAKRIVLLLFFFPGILALGPHALGDEIYHYQGKVGDRIRNFKWQLVKSDFDVITSKQNGFTLTNVCRHNGETIMWKIEGPETSFQAHRSGNQLIIKGKKYNETVNNKWKIDDAPWFQPLSYSLRQFSKSDRNKVYFWTIRFDNLTVRKLRAKKKSLSELMVGTMPVNSQLVEVKLKWGLSMLWKAKYWFRVEDGLFLKYEGIHGFPGTDKTIITMEPRLDAKQFADNRLVQ
jgi:hypothetical protein